MRTSLIKPILLSEIGKWCGAKLLTEDSYITGISTHSSEVSDGDLFVALNGENFNGEEYIAEAVANGGKVLSSGCELTSLSTDSPRDALLKIAAEYKRRILKNIRLTVAITGSVGKTTVKEFTRRILVKGFNVHATEKNFNNEIGLAFTLLSTPENAEILVCELGMNHLGEIYALAKALEPDIAVITNIGNAHIGNLGSREMIAKAKLEISESPKLNTLFIPYGEPLLSAAPHSLTVSETDSAADFFINEVSLTEKGSKFDFYVNKKRCLSSQCAIAGRHILSSLAYAISIGYLLGIAPSEIENSISCITEGSLRQKFQRIGMYTIYNDTYSSSPEALTATIDMLTLKREKCSAVLGDMLELGNKTEEFHRMIGRYVCERGFSKIYTYGQYGNFIAEGALSVGMSEKNIFTNPDSCAPKKTAEQILRSYSGGILLIKGSHALGMERIIDELRKHGS